MGPNRKIPLRPPQETVGALVLKDAMDIKDLDFQKDWVLPEFKDKITTLERDRPLPISTKIWLPLTGLGGVTELLVEANNKEIQPKTNTPKPL